MLNEQFNLMHHHRAENRPLYLRYMVLMLRTNNDLIHVFPADVSGEVKVEMIMGDTTHFQGFRSASVVD